MNVIPCTTWVKRGVAASNPQKVELTPCELEAIIKQTKVKLEDAEHGSEEESDDDVIVQTATDVTPSTANPEDEYGFDKYDEESGNIHCSIANIASFGEGGKDPLLTTGDKDDDSEKEDDIIKNDDNLVLIGRVEGDASILEVFVYNEAEGSFYCHHDILLPSFPLCIEWLNFDPVDPKPSNLCAIGNMTPIIEVWDLDVIDCLEPAYSLGCKPSKKKEQKRVGHKDAVLDLSWNKNYVHVLASGSVDQSVLLWDLETGKPVSKFKSFNEKVQSIQWHPMETHQLLTGCADKLVRLFDCRQEDMTKSWKAQGEVERVLWNHFDTYHCLVGTNNGYLQYVDIRTDRPVWEISAHENEITGLSLSLLCPGLLVSSSSDGVIKAWDIIDNKCSQHIWEKKSNLGSLQCLAANPNNAFVFALGGDNKAHNFKIIDFREIPEVYTRFSNRQQYCPVLPKTEVKSEEMMDVTEDIQIMTLEAGDVIKEEDELQN